MAGQGQTLALGIDVGGTKIGFGLVSAEGTLVSFAREPMVPGRVEDFAEALRERAKAFLAQEAAGHKLCGVGMGVKGLVDYQTRCLRDSSVLQTDAPYPFGQRLEEWLGLPAALDNDVHAATMAEWYFGAGRQSENFVYVNLGTGAALGIVADGRMVRGAHNASGEFGQFLYGGAGTAGRAEVIESVVSGKGICEEVVRLLPAYPGSRLAEDHRKQQLHSSAIFAAARAGDALACGVVATMVDALAGLVMDLQHLLDPQRFVFGGGVVGDGWIVEQVRSKSRDIAEQTGFAAAPVIEVSSLGAPHVGVLGAACLALQEFAPVGTAKG